VLFLSRISQQNTRFVSVTVNELTQQRLKTHRAARTETQQRERQKTAVYLRAADKSQQEMCGAYCSRVSTEFLQKNLIFKPYNLQIRSLLSSPIKPLNFIPSRAIQGGLLSVDRAVREIPFQSRLDLLKYRKRPVYFAESIGTPRRENQTGLINSIRVRSVFNPSFVPNRQKIRQLKTWKSRDWRKWNPHGCHVRGSKLRYTIPEDLRPSKDELGRTIPPKISSRYQADVRYQYTMNGLPWIFEKNFMEIKANSRDIIPPQKPRWLLRQVKLAKITKSLQSMPSIVEEYRKERLLAKKNTWFERIVFEIAGEQVANDFIRKPKLPKH
jgi:hypothetical protein